MNNQKIKITQIPTFYINLDEETDRKKKMEKLLSELEFENFERFPGTKSNNRVGCSISHAALLQKIVNENIYPALVLEDDLSVFSFTKNAECPKDADALYLGISKMGWGEALAVSEKTNKYHRVHNMLARHAIVHMNKDFDEKSIELMKKFIIEPQKYVAGDVTLTSILPEYKIYALNKPMFYQNADGTRGLTKKSIDDCSYVELDKV
jgi:hypothetical protein